MTTGDIIGMIAVLFSTLIVSVTLGRQLKLDIRLVWLLTIWHTAFCIVYWVWSQTAPADSNTYFSNALSNNYAWRPGTTFVTSFTKIFADLLGLSKLNTFLVFNLIGLSGLLLLANVLSRFWVYRKGASRLILYVILFLPGLSFWSSAIGKDAISFFAVCLAAYAFLDISKRKFAFSFAVLIMFLVRPHIGLLMLFSAGIAIVFGKGISWIQRALLLITSLFAGVFALAFVLNYVGLGETTSLEQITEYVEKRQGYNLGGGSSVLISEMSVPMQMFTYLFRPLFFDAPGVLGLIVSVENLIILSLFIYFIPKHILGIAKNRNPAVKYHTIFALVSLLVLSGTTANLGIAVRQKAMLMPSILFLVSVVANARYQRRYRMRTPYRNLYQNSHRSV